MDVVNAGFYHKENLAHRSWRGPLRQVLVYVQVQVHISLSIVLIQDVAGVLNLASLLNHQLHEKNQICPASANLLDRGEDRPSL